MKLIFGLGNPGLKYKNNRHNIGYIIVEEAAKKNKRSFKKSIFLGAWLLTGNVKVQGQGTQLVKPAGFMNNSGLCVKRVCKKYKSSFSDILVVYDDVDLPLGVVRFKKSGSSGGHRGMESIIQQLGTEEINRLKIGIGRNDHLDTADYVLSDFSASEKEVLVKVIEKAVLTCIDWVAGGK